MPRTLAQNAQYIAETIKPAIKSAIEAQGVTVPSTDSFLDYADRIGEIEGGGSGYQLKDLPTGSISTVNNAAELPLNALKVSVEVVQSGSGTPSPDNVRPISGWDSATINNFAVNIWDEEWEVGGINDSTGEKTPATTQIRSVNLIPCIGGNAYKIYSATTNISIYIYYYDRFGEFIGRAGQSGAYDVRNQVLTTPDNCGYMMLKAGTLTTYNHDISINYPATDTSYYAYQGTTRTVDFGRDVYNARADLLNGTGEDDRNEIDLGDLQWQKGATLWYANLPTEHKSYAGSQTPILVTDGCSFEMIPKSSNALSGISGSNEASFGIDSTVSSFRWYVDLAVAQSGTDFAELVRGQKLVYELATPEPFTFTPIPYIKMLQGTNNIFADCGDIIEGEYFVDEGAIDVRKVDYSIGSNSALKISDGRILQGFANMASYQSRPLDASGNWLDVDWSKSFEIGIAFKYTVADTNQTLFGSGIGNANYYKCPMIMLHPASQQFEIDISTTGNSWDMTMSQTVTYASLTINTWYFLRMIFNQSDMSLVIQISDDFSTWDTLLSITMSSAYYHDTASLCFGGFVQNSSFSSNNLLIDTFNTYIKGDGVSWGASTEVFPS